MVAGKEEVKLSFKVGGIVQRVFVEEGAAVSAGQRLATLKLPEVNAAVTQNSRGLEKAERDLERVRDLYDGRAATLEQLQNATTAVDVARAALSGASFNQEHAVIRAPAAGRILRRFAENDELVGPGSPVLLLRASGRGWILRVGITDADVMRVTLGDSATLTFAAIPGQTFAAVVSEIAENASPLTGSYELELRIEPRGSRLRSGLIARAEIHPTPVATYGFLPMEALQDGDGERAVVFVPASEAGRTTAQPRAVTIDHLDGERAAIASGLGAASTVITDGAAKLTPGAAIEIAEDVTTAQVRP
jgi:RND family efflux transporter MFP subunit